MSDDAEETVVPVVIVGAGPTGVAAATMLAQRGIGPLVIERWSDVYPLPRAVHLDDEIYRILQGLGAADAFGGITRPTSGMRLLDARHRTMAELRRNRPVGQHGYPQANMFDQPELERVLRDNLDKYPIAQLRGGTELLQIEQDLRGGPAPVRVTVREVATGQVRQIWTQVVLGCDGANSTVRNLIGATMQDLRFEERWLVIDLRCATQLQTWDGVHQVCDPGRAATYMQIGPDRYRFEFRLADGEAPDELVEPGRLAELIAPWTRDVPVEHLKILRKAEYTFKARIADRWRERRVFLLGDAAHLTPPFIGQGMCAGMRDAANLAWKLALVLTGQADEALLDTYQAERMKPARKLIKTAVTVGWVMTGGQDTAAWVRRGALAGLCRLPGFTDKVLDTAAPRLPDGPLARRRGRFRRSLAGSPVPQPWVTVDGHRSRLDDILGESFAVLTTGPTDPELSALAHRLGAPVLRIVAQRGSIAATPDPDAVQAVDIDGALTRWMSRAGAGAVLVRPDRVVLAQAPARKDAARPVGREIAADAAAWLPLFPAMSVTR